MEERPLFTTTSVLRPLGFPLLGLIGALTLPGNFGTAGWVWAIGVITLAGGLSVALVWRFELWYSNLVLSLGPFGLIKITIPRELLELRLHSQRLEVRRGVSGRIGLCRRAHMYFDAPMDVDGLLSVLRMEGLLPEDSEL